VASILVDTGAEVSYPLLLPTVDIDKTTSAVNDTPIATYGNRLLTINIGLRRNFQWIFIVADVKQPIIGADFLRHYNLLVDIVHNRLTDALTHLQVQGITTTDISPSLALLSRQPRNEFEALLSSCTNSDGSNNDDNDGSSSSDEYSNSYSETESESEPIEAKITDSDFYYTTYDVM